MSIRLLLLKEKHQTRIISLPKDEDRARIALKIFQEREEAGYYVEEDMNKKHLQFYQKALAGDKDAALTFINLRSKHEYEGYEIVYAEEL